MSSNKNEIGAAEAPTTETTSLEPSLGDFKRITKEEFEETLSEIELPNSVEPWEIIDAAGRETTYAFNIQDTVLEVRVISTIENGTARDRGEDAIRTMLYHQQAERIIEMKSRTNRQYGYGSNLTPKVTDLMQNWRQYWNGFCPECDFGVLQEKNAKYGRFIGCNNFPECEFTLNL